MIWGPDLITCALSDLSEAVKTEMSDILSMIGIDGKAFLGAGFGNGGGSIAGDWEQPKFYPVPGGA